MQFTADTEAIRTSGERYEQAAAAASAVAASRRIDDVAVALPGGRAAREAASAGAAWRASERGLTRVLTDQVAAVHEAMQGYTSVEAGTTNSLRGAR